MIFLSPAVPHSGRIGTKALEDVRLRVDPQVLRVLDYWLHVLSLVTCHLSSLSCLNTRTPIPTAFML